MDCISGLPLYELTTPANTPDSNVAAEILANANQTISLQNCSFIADKGYDARSIYNTVKDVYDGEAFIPLKNYSTKNSKKLASGNPICEAGLAMHKDGKTTDNGRTRQKYCCPFRQSKTGQCPCNHRNWNNGKKNRGCTKYKTIPNDYRLSIDRSCLSFKRTYALRTECERYNSRFKCTGQERLWVHNSVSATNLNTIAHYSLCRNIAARHSLIPQQKSFAKSCLKILLFLFWHSLTPVSCLCSPFPPTYRSIT